MKVIITYEITDMWASPEFLATMTDAEVLELLHEDDGQITEDGTWEIIR